MRMISPQLSAPQITIAEDQHEFKQVTAALVHNPLYPARATSDGPVNTVLLAFRPSAEERRRLAAGDDVYIGLLTFGGPMQPIIVLCGATEAAAGFGLEVVR